MASVCEMFLENFNSSMMKRSLQAHIAFILAVDDEGNLTFSTLDIENKSTACSLSEYAQDFDVCERNNVEYMQRVVKCVVAASNFFLPKIENPTNMIYYLSYFCCVMTKVWKLRKQNPSKCLICNTMMILSSLSHFGVKHPELGRLFGANFQPVNVDVAFTRYVEGLWKNFMFDEFVFVHEASKKFDFTHTTNSPAGLGSRVLIFYVTFFTERDRLEQEGVGGAMTGITQEAKDFLERIVAKFGDDFSKGTVIAYSPLSLLLADYIYEDMHRGNEEVAKQGLIELLFIAGFKELAKKQLKENLLFRTKLLNAKERSENLVNFLIQKICE